MKENEIQKKEETKIRTQFLRFNNWLFLREPINEAHYHYLIIVLIFSK